MTRAGRKGGRSSPPLQELSRAVRVSFVGWLTGFPVFFGILYSSGLRHCYLLTPVHAGCPVVFQLFFASMR